MPPRKSPPPGTWKYQVGEVPIQLTAYERADKGNAIYTRVWDGRRYGRKRALCGPIRTKAGRIIPERETAAQELAIRRQSEIARGVETGEDAGRRLTLAAGFRRLLHEAEGKFPADSPYRREVARSSRLVMDVLGRDLLFEEVRHRHYRQVWRHLAHAHVRTGQYGYRTAELVCACFQTAARWLQQEGYLEPGDAVPAPGWKRAMRTEWEQITTRPVAKAEKPRYTDAETVAIWRALPSADPRVALAAEIGAELRLGQVARVRRSDILPYRGHAIGVVVVHGRGKKLGEEIILTRAQRHAITRALASGLLALPEAAYRAGEIEDYYLIAGGRLHLATLRRGGLVKRVRVAGAARPMGKRALARHWERLEAVAKVDHVEGRLWYGMRRIQADKAQALPGVSDRAKNRMGGWSRTSTREGYLEEANRRDAEEAAQARERIRPARKTGRTGTRKTAELPPIVTPEAKAGESQTTGMTDNER